MKRKSLMIVCDEKTISYANYLKQLISNNDDNGDQIIGVKDGSVTTVVWLEKDYISNRQQISSNTHILFIGSNKTTKSEMKTVNIKFDKFGIKYGWLGKSSVLYVEKKILNKKEYREFIEFAIQYQKAFDDVIAKNNWLDIGARFSLTANVFFSLLGGLVIGAGAGVFHAVKLDKEIKEQQYIFAVLHLYLESLSEFLEG